MKIIKKASLWKGLDWQDCVLPEKDLVERGFYTFNHQTI